MWQTNKRSSFEMNKRQYRRRSVCRLQSFSDLHGPLSLCQHAIISVRATSTNACMHTPAIVVESSKRDCSVTKPKVAPLILFATAVTQARSHSGVTVTAVRDNRSTQNNSQTVHESKQYAHERANNERSQHAME